MARKKSIEVPAEVEPKIDGIPKVEEKIEEVPKLTKKVKEEKPKKVEPTFEELSNEYVFSQKQALEKFYTKTNNKSALNQLRAK